MGPASRNGAGKLLSRFAAALPLWSIVLFCCALPLGWIVAQIVLHPGALIELRVDGFRFGLLLRTLVYNGAAALVATLLGLPAAVALGRGPRAVAAVLWFVLPVTLLFPSISYAYGWSQFLRLLNVYLEPQTLGDVARAVWSLATWLWALPAAVIGLALMRVDPQVQQQALLDGALWRVTARQLLGPAVAAAAMVAVLAMQEFAVYEPSGISVVATEVRMVFDTGAFSSAENPITTPITPASFDLAGLRTLPARAAAAVVTAAPLLIVIGLLTAVAIGLLRGRGANESLGFEPVPRALQAGPLPIALTLIVITIAVGVPVASLLLSRKRPFNPVEIWTVFQPQLLGSLMIASIAGAVALVAAMLAALRRARVPLWLGTLCFLIGGQLLAIALIRLYNQPWLAWVYNAWPIVVLVYFARFGWIALLAGATTHRGPWRPLRELAAVDGACPWQTLRFVVGPLAWPIFLAAGVLVMILSLTEVPATVLLAPQQPPMLTPLLMGWVHMLRYDDMIDGSLLLMSVVMILALIAAALVWLGLRLITRTRCIVSLCLLPTAYCVLLTGCNRSGSPDAVWLETGTGPAQVIYPRGISYSPADDTFFIVDRLARIQQIDRQGNFISGWEMPLSKYGKPVGLSVGLDGNVYVPDTHYHRVMVYSRDADSGQWSLVRQWGELGNGPGQFVYPTDVAFDAKGNIFVTEYGDHDRVQVFNPQGDYLYEFGRFGTGDGEFMRPQSMVIDGELVYIADACNHRIAVFKTDGTFVRNMGGVGSELGQFRYPYGLDQDSAGNLIVCEFGNNRVQLIDKTTGRGLKMWGTGGRDPGQLAYPWAVAVDKRDRVVALDSGNNRIQVFEF